MVERFFRADVCLISDSVAVGECRDVATAEMYAERSDVVCHLKPEGKLCIRIPDLVLLLVNHNHNCGDQRHVQHDAHAVLVH